MRTERVAFNVPVDILASLKIGTRGLESDMRRSYIPALKRSNWIKVRKVKSQADAELLLTLKTMARYGIVKMEKVRRNIRPVVEATDFTVQFGLYTSSRREHGAEG